MYSHQTIFTAATANIHFGDSIRLNGGLDALRTYAPDVLLLQEVTNPLNELVRQLGKANYGLIDFAPEFGLAIALRLNSNFSAIPNSIKAYELQKMSSIEYRLAQRFARHSHKMIAHGMQALQLKAQHGSSLTVVNTRTTVSSNRIGRAVQITRMGNELTKPYYAGALIVGGDMNHFPGPQWIDRNMHKKTGLKQVDLGGEPTWRARNSRLYRTIARTRRQPLETLQAQLDTLLYRGEIEPVDTKIVDILSDHRAIVGRFALHEA